MRATRLLIEKIMVERAISIFPPVAIREVKIKMHLDRFPVTVSAFFEFVKVILNKTG